MAAGLLLVAYLALLFLASAVLSPPLFWMGEHVMARGWAPFLEGFRYPIYFSRTLQFLTLLTFWSFLRLGGIQRWRDLGLRPNPRGRRDVVVGLSLGFGLLGLVGTILVLAGLSRPRVTPPWHEVPAILLAALLVPLLEETLFRGALFGVLRRAMASMPALLLVSAVFATLHFIRWTVRTPPGMPVEWHTGFALLADMLRSLSDPRAALAGWCALFVAGLVLGDCVLRTGSLHLPIGVHAGWVLGQRTFEEFFTRPAAGNWVGPRLTNGIAPLLALLATWALLRWWTRRGRPDGVASSGDAGPEGP